MEQEQEEWSEVDTTAPKEEKIEYEVEGEENEEDKVPSPVTTKEEITTEEAPKKEEPKELEGIETKGAQKRIRQLVKQRKERDEKLAELMRQNEELNKKLNSSQHQFNTVSKLNLDASEKQITDKLELARNAYKSAHEEGDSAKILQAQEFLNEAQNDLKSLNVTKQQFDQQPVQQEQPQQPVQQQYQPQPTPDPRASEWAQRNEWFGSDQVMTAASLAIDGQLKEEGFNPTDPEYYTEIDRRMRETFPHKFAANAAPVEEVRKQEEASKPAQVVAGASRSSPGSSKKVKLSKEDIRLANKWNIPLEQYALEKQKADRAEGEYTTINMQRGGNK
tara:strand:+ start:2927 stop:3928 length:1002 start_codon:yes stop_codon:yes gene_type:complete